MENLRYGRQGLIRSGICRTSERIQFIPTTASSSFYRKHLHRERPACLHHILCTALPVCLSKRGFLYIDVGAGARKETQKTVREYRHIKYLSDQVTELT